ncbi:MAG: folate-binding protein YgfZ [Pseudomonadota bacterium]|nr:folate-binding protein YgfZ [Pseudomonadota bacterium]
MLESWNTHLAGNGATIEGSRVAHFGDPGAELRAAATGAILCDLSHRSVIAFSGDERHAFLHGQLTSDVKNLGAGGSRYAGYCTPKGRLLATFLVWQNDRAIYAQLPCELRESVQKRLSMYVLRSKVVLTDASSDFVRCGLGGPGAAAMIKGSIGDAPAHDYEVSHSGEISVIRLPAGRFQINVPIERAIGLWDALRQEATCAGAACWDWLEIRAGLPTLTAATQEEFVPQMLNLDALGAISFSKGCYPGQEIVARTHYLGKIKRRMYRAHVVSDAVPAPGDKVFSAENNDQPGGMIVNAAPAPDGGFDVLAAIQTSSAESGAIHLGSPSGAPLSLLDLPYSLP